MTEISRHIEILLLDNDCVVVPGLGGFMAHYVKAEFIESEELFYPPCRTIGFNPQLQHNDSLLAQSYEEAYDLSYPEAVRRICSEVDEIKKQISVEGSYEFHGVGILTLTADGHYDFLPSVSGLLTPTLYALNSFEISRVNFNTSTEELSQKQEYRINIPIKNEEEENHSEELIGRGIHVDVTTLKTVAAAAIILILFVFASIPVGTGSSGPQQCSVINTQMLSKVVKTKPEKNLVQDTISNSFVSEVADSSVIQSIDETAQKVNVKVYEPDVHYYVLVVAAKVSKAGAKDLVLKLRKSGFVDTNISEQNSTRKVIYGHYKSEREAFKALESLRGQDITFTDAWISKI